MANFGLSMQNQMGGEMSSGMNPNPVDAFNPPQVSAGLSPVMNFNFGGMNPNPDGTFNPLRFSAGSSPVVNFNFGEMDPNQNLPQQSTNDPPDVSGYLQIKLHKDDQLIGTLNIMFKVQLAPDFSSLYIPLKSIESYCIIDSNQPSSKFTLSSSVDLSLNGNYHFQSKQRSQMFLYPKKPEPNQKSYMFLRPVIPIYPGK
jgi:hypothetical protein